MKEADKQFSIFIRQRDNGTCFTCGLQKHWKEMQNGHFVPRQYKRTRYDETNCHAQCYVCNVLYGGQPSVYATKLGQEEVARLEALRQEDKRNPIKLDYKAIYNHYLGENMRKM